MFGALPLVMNRLPSSGKTGSDRAASMSKRLLRGGVYDWLRGSLLITRGVIEGFVEPLMMFVEHLIISVGDV